ncbi:VOC family protein [Nocardia sp. NRRL S-836]|uniref:VOC family protein n=1 Tax=Nocardia sp. NRRL S-836 TaxID=1519492 RepID=UPI0006AE3D0F|nr:VOC family protein [Nocardia sp. NRRL S-836]
MEITFDAADPPALAAFWSELAGDEAELTFVWSDAPKIEKNRVHLDLASTSPEHQADIVARALKLGAEHADVGQRDVPWVVLRDPQGNEFCVLEPRPEYTGVIAAVVVDARDPLAAALVTGHPVVRSGDGFASVRPEPDGPWLEFVRTDDPDPITHRVRVHWAAPVS